MSPFVSEGTFTSESREVAVSETWDTWANAQAMNNVEVVDGSLQLAEAQPPIVSRPDDADSFNTTTPYGIRIETSVEWAEFGGRISSNTSSSTRSYLYRAIDGQLMGDTDISPLTAGDAFTINLDDNLVPGEAYNFVIDAEGSDYTAGFYSDAQFPYTSDGGGLSITNGANGSTGDTGTVNNIVEAGAVGGATP